jgi:hypothetical protein
VKLDGRHVGAAVALGAAAGLAFLATRSAGPIRIPTFSEDYPGPLMEHLVTLEEYGPRAPLPHRYPSKVAPGMTQVVAVGFAPMWQLPDPQAAALPAESD